MKAIFTLAALFGLPAVANAAIAATAAAAHPVNTIAISMFVVFVGATLAITWWAARKNNSASDHYAAGGRITAWQNGFAIAGDYMSAASILASRR
jgi:cation/acetate symporter